MRKERWGELVGTFVIESVEPVAIRSLPNDVHVAASSRSLYSTRYLFPASAVHVSEKFWPLSVGVLKRGPVNVLRMLAARGVAELGMSVMLALPSGSRPDRKSTRLN